jgi:hypothetical protein
VPEELDPAIAEDLVDSAMGFLPLTRGNKVLCTKRQLRECMSRLAQEAYATGFLLGQKEHFSSLGIGERPAWIDIRLDDPQDLAKDNIRLRPIVLRSLAGAGYRCLGDLCWVPDHELRKLSYIGRTTTRELRNIIRQFQARPREGEHDS